MYLYNQEIINFLERVNFSFPLSPDKIVSSFKSFTVENSGKEKIPKENKSTFTSRLYIFLFLMAFFTNGCPHEHPPNIDKEVTTEVSEGITSACLISYYKILSELITTEFESFFWQYSATHAYTTMADFSKKDFDIFEVEYWKIIEAKRMVILQMENGDELILKVEKVFTEKDFQNNFEEFIKAHHQDSLQDFSKNMVAYVTKIQDNILDKVIHY